VPLARQPRGNPLPLDPLEFGTREHMTNRAPQRVRWESRRAVRRLL
jgi:hypothetical protein